MKKVRILSFILIFALVFTSIQIPVFATNDSNTSFSDIEGHWAEDTIKKHAEQGFLKGYPDGSFKPDQGMKRCELITLINRYFGLQDVSDDNYDDVDSDAWYVNETAKAKYYDYVHALNVEPEKEATREDVIGMLALFVDAEEEEHSDVASFKDIKSLEADSQENIKNFSEMGYIKGYPGGEFKPDKVINRAEIMTMADSVLGYIVASQEDADNIPKDAKKVSVIKSDITIDNLNTNGDLYIGPGVKGKVTIKDSNIKGKVEISGGTGEHDVDFTHTTINKIVVTKGKGTPKVNIKDSKINEVKVKRETKIETDEKTTVEKADIHSKSTWEGKGTIKRAYVDSDDVEIKKKPTFVKVTKKNVTVNVEGKEVKKKATAKTSTSSGGTKKKRDHDKVVVPSKPTLEAGWIPLANKDEIQQINREEVLTFGLGTPYEGKYTGGLDKNYILVKDIDLEDENFMPIGYIEGTSKEFTGKLKGNKFKISNLKIDRDEEKQGLFTILGKGSEILGLTIEGADMKTGSYSGVLAGEANGAKIEDCEISSVVYDLPKNTAEKWYYDIGGYVGKSKYTSFIDNRLEDFKMEVSDSVAVNPMLFGLGGLIGELDGGKVENCHLEDIRLSQKYDPIAFQTYNFRFTGGLIGKVNNSSDEILDIKNSSVEDVYIMVGGTGFEDDAGGFIGEIDTSDTDVETKGNINIENCTVSGDVGGGGHLGYTNGVSLAGGFIGIVNGSGTPDKLIKISNCDAKVDIKELRIGMGFLDTAISIGGIGGFAGRIHFADVSNCSAKGSYGLYGPSDLTKEAIDEFSTINGFAGWITDSTIIDCSTDCEIFGNGWGSGFSFMFRNSKMERVDVNVRRHIRIEGLNASSLISWSDGESTIKDCIISGYMDKSKASGGVIGNYAGQFVLENVIINSKIEDYIDSGILMGLTGELKSGKGIYYNKTLNPTIPVGGTSNVNDKYVEGKTEEELMKMSTFLGYDISLEGTDANTVWKIKEGESLPYLNKSYDVELAKEEIKAALGGWIPLASKEELQQINKDEALVFGAGTLYEETYTGGLDKKYILVKDIDLEDENFMPIGYSEGKSKEFTGKLKGNKFKITNLKIDRDEEKQGLFTILGEGSEIMGLTIEGADMKTGSYSGVLSGEANGAKIEDCEISGVEYDLFKRDSGDFYFDIGGYVGKSKHSTFKDNELKNFNMEVSDSNSKEPNLYNLGGIIGELDGGTVDDCHVEDIKVAQKVDINETEGYALYGVGGIIGEANNSFNGLLEISNCSSKNIDFVVGGLGVRDGAGGIIGRINTKDSAFETKGDITIRNCKAEGKIQGGGSRAEGATIVGGIAGYVDGSGSKEGKIKIEDCTANVEIEDLGMSSAYVDNVISKGGVGGFIGRAISVSMVNCHAEGIYGKYADPGEDRIDEEAVINGFAGMIKDSSLIDCSTKAEIYANGMLGGMAVYAKNSSFERCTVDVIVHIKEEIKFQTIFTSGFIHMPSGISIKDCIIKGNIEEGNMVSGVFGSGSGMSIENLIIDLAIVDKHNSGILTGMTSEFKSGKGIYYNKTKNPTVAISGDKSNVNDKYIEGKSQEELQVMATFVGFDISAEGTDDNTVWKIKEGESLPYLNKDYDSTIVKEDPSPIILKSVAFPEIKAVKAVEVILEEPKAELLKKEVPALEEPKEEAPVAEEPKEEVSVAEEPKEESPELEEPKEESPELEEPKEESPELEEPKEEAPELEEPKGEAPELEEPKEEAPEVEEPKEEAPELEKPKGEAPELEEPKEEAPELEEPKEESPELEEPKEEAPEVEEPKEEAPEVEEPKEEAPEVEEPKEEAPKVKETKEESLVLDELK